MKRLVAAFVFTALHLAASPEASASIYADWTLTSGTNGTGTFGGMSGMPDFVFSLTGDVTSASTQIDDNDVFDNAGWEATFGEGDNQESLRFASPGVDALDQEAITVSAATITFAAPVNPSGSWAFAVTDLEGEDAVISASLGGSPIADATIGGWLAGLFDSKPATAGSPHVPSGFDAANVAVVAEVDSDGLLSNETFNDFGGLGGTESPSAWFVPNTPIDSLTIVHRNRFGSGASMHVYIAAAGTGTSTPIPEPSTFIVFGTFSVLALGNLWRR